MRAEIPHPFLMDIEGNQNIGHGQSDPSQTIRDDSATHASSIIENVLDDLETSPDISLSSQRTLHYCDVEGDQQQGLHDTSHESSDSIETLNEPPSQDTHTDLNNKILEQLSLTCQNLKQSVESHERREREHRNNKTQQLKVDDHDSIVSSGDSHEVIIDSTVNKLRPESLSLSQPIQAKEKEQADTASESDFQSVKQTLSKHSSDQERGAHFISPANLSSNLPSGTILRKGDMIEFVADNLEEKIKLSSPVAVQGKLKVNQFYTNSNI